MLQMLSEWVKSVEKRKVVCMCRAIFLKTLNQTRSSVHRAVPHGNGHKMEQMWQKVEKSLPNSTGGALSLGIITCYTSAYLHKEKREAKLIYVMQNN